nr:unnamed protein product [Spirometra erinaceieuropaei]
MPQDEHVVYGQIILLGTNGDVRPKCCNPRALSKLTLYRRKIANGVAPGPVTVVPNSESSAAVRSTSRHSVSYTVGRSNTVVVEYLRNPNIDQFQLGRCAAPVIDFVLADSNPNFDDQPDEAVTPRATDKSNGRFLYFRPRGPKALREPPCSTVSRFACRIIVNRNPPHEARIYAAGFDMQRNIFLGEQAIKWRHEQMMDGFTTNGVRILRPQTEEGNPGNRSGQNPSVVESPWREVSVCGRIYKLYSNLFVPKECDELPEDNVLADGTLIDLSGAILLWRSADSLRKNLTLEELAYMVSILNQTHVQCPVLYKTLRFDDHFLHPSNKPPLNSTNVPGGSSLTCATFGNRQPFVYLNCGHVHGWHPWRHRNDPDDRSADRTCPLCRQASRFVPLTFGEEVAFYVDHGPPTHCFNPCGHIASEATVRYWCSLKLPSPKSPEMRPRCPFCGIAVKPEPVRLILQHNADEDTLLAAFSVFDPSLYPTPPLSSSPDSVTPTSVASTSPVSAQLNCPD